MFSYPPVRRVLVWIAGLFLVIAPSVHAQSPPSPNVLQTPVPLKALSDVTPQALTAADARLSAKITLAAKSTALSDLCQRLSAETGITFTADRMVADDKITLFCRERPLADILSQIALLFNFSWSRTGEADAYRYTLFQEGYARKAEAELREEDIDTIFKRLDAKMEGYRPYLNRSLEELEARQAQTQDKEEKERLRQYLGNMALPAAAYLRMSRQDKIALFKGETLEFDSAPRSPRALPPNVARIPTRAQWKRMESGAVSFGIDNHKIIPVEAEMQSGVNLRLRREKEGGYTFLHRQFVTFPIPPEVPISAAARRTERHRTDTIGGNISLQAPEIADFKNKVANASRARDADMQAEISLTLVPLGEVKHYYRSPIREGPITTMAAALEALHLATGKDIISDSFARLIALNAPNTRTFREGRVFDVLNVLADGQRMHWTKRDKWFTFRTLEYYKARPQEVPNRLLERWSQKVKESGLSPDILLEIASLTDVQIENGWNGAVVQALYGIDGWHVVAHENLQPHWQMLASLPARLRKTALSAKGVSYNVMPWQCQRRFIELGFISTPNREGRLAGMDNAPESNDPALKGASFRVQFPDKPGQDYTFTRFIYRYGKPIQGGFVGRMFTRNKFSALEAGEKTE